MLKHLKDILVQATSHGVGQKRVLLRAEETHTPLTQIAVTTLQAGETAEEHTHTTMEEYFFFLNGKAVLTIKGKSIECQANDFVQVKSGESHILQAVTEVEVLTIGVGTRTLSANHLNNNS